MTTRIPITILSGYLGAGKTTIINRLLSGDHGRRVAVLVNDFGAVNIDASLIETEDDNTISLTNGCVCCSIGDDLGAALDAQAARHIPPENILLEASGVAEPKRIATHVGFWPGFELDALIVAADAETVRNRANDKFVGQLVRSQIRHADIIALTKTDLVGPEAARGVKAWLRNQVPNARIFEAPNGTLPVALAFGADRASNALSGPVEPAPHSHLRTVMCVPGTGLSRAGLARAIEALPSSVHRVKGFFRDLETGRMTLLQCVGRRHEFLEAPTDTETVLVLIGVGSDTEMNGAMDLLTASDALEADPKSTFAARISD
ncbi:hypothetical protein HBA54_17435 [Pelagibius litoralis]|uniref:CobW C-terminal domain-containing protein n=1 Tax=Pelagibius litoralis TaxID=374515 RepID=A0A967EZR2_9PROT|nr:GTP-binding protein [Pelagibius litoralis]NIA70390.1 hypothetical protein [Pelagibius litoralis]